MDDSIKLVFAIFGTLGTVLLGLIARGVVNISKDQSNLQTDVKLIKSDVDHMKSKVNSLHQFRNDLEEEKAKNLMEENKALKSALGKRSGDNV